MPYESRPRRHDLWRNLFLVALVAIGGAIAVTWAWNTTVPGLSGLARMRFAEGMSLAILVLFVGALFESGRRLVSRRDVS
jgi:hypothetical protein